MSTLTKKYAFPELFETAKTLVDDYEARGTGKILLALYFQPAEPEADLDIFLVIDQFFHNEVWPNEVLFDVTYRTSPQIPLPGIDTFHLTITNPVELETAARNKWTKLLDVMQAVKEGKFRTLRISEQGSNMLELLKLK